MTPKKMLMVASVMMKLCRPDLTTAQPLTKPSAAPIAMPPRMATGQGRPAPSISQPDAMAAHTPMAPTARLSPPVTMTVIMAKPIMMLIAAVRPSVNWLNEDRNPDVNRAKQTPNTRISTSRPNSLVR